jgi:hypothetical protein
MSLAVHRSSYAAVRGAARQDILEFLFENSTAGSEPTLELEVHGIIGAGLFGILEA